MNEAPRSSDESASRALPEVWVPLASVAGSVAIAVLLVLAWMGTSSHLALAQAADSLSDSLTGIALAWAARVARKPADREHPLGHHRAEPIAALVVAIFAGVLATEVARDAVIGLLGMHAVSPEPILAVGLVAKVVLKSGIYVTAKQAMRGRISPTLEALAVDAKNDVVVSSVGLVGLVAVRQGFPIVDPLLALAVAVYVGITGFRLASANISLLLGEAVEESEREEVRTRIEARGHVVRRLDVVTHGTRRDVHVELTLPRGTALEDAVAAEQDVRDVAGPASSVRVSFSIR